MRYELTSEIIEELMTNNKSIPTKSLLREIFKITEREDMSIEEVLTVTHGTASKLKEKVNIEQNTKTSIALRYLLDKKCEASSDLTRKLFMWSNNPKYSRLPAEAG